HATAGEHELPGAEGHRGLAPHQVRLETVLTVARDDDRRRQPGLDRGALEDLGIEGLGKGGTHQATSTISSTSTGASRGSTATPTALRACRPASPKAWPNSSLAPLATAACPVKSGALATKTPTLTTRVTVSRSPISALTAAMAFSAHW